MLKLNLISKNLKKEIKEKHLYKLVQKANTVFVFITIIISILFFTAKIIISKNYNDLNNQTNIIPINNKEYDRKIKEINKKISSASIVQNNFIPYSNLLKELTSVIDPEISLNYLQINSEKKTLKIKGVAKNREKLLGLKDDLNNLPILSGADIPLTNILQKENINFEINTNLILNKLSK